VNNGEASAEQVISALRQARSILRSAGYQGPVVAVDTFIATEAHPELCEESDYCAINAHAFFDSTISADEAGPWLEKTVRSIKSKLSSEKEVIITETGWPTEGSANGLAVPGLDNQKRALESISKSFSGSPGNVILFSAFNDLWKGDRDKYWGIGGAVSRCDR
jgi:exo-beta-1,3-glucanase (GH17 family)